jgi:hypothetical protein
LARLSDRAPATRYRARVGLFRRNCKDCGQSAELKVEPLVHGQFGTSEVEFPASSTLVDGTGAAAQPTAAKHWMRP